MKGIISTWEARILYINQPAYNPTQKTKEAEGRVVLNENRNQILVRISLNSNMDPRCLIKWENSQSISKKTTDVLKTHLCPQLQKMIDEFLNT